VTQGIMMNRRQL